MSKPVAKRKRASRADVDYADDSDASMASAAAAALPTPLRDLTNAKTKRKDVTAALLSLLPDGATKQSAAAKKLVSAFPQVIAELDARSKALARANESEGTRLPISFRFDNDGGDESLINMPEECFVNVLRYLKGREVVKSSLVSKVWLSASRMPALWERLDRSSGLTNKSKKMNMTSLIKLLGRPQFANLKLLVVPKVRLGKNSIKQIAKTCPQLTALDAGYADGSVHLKECDFEDVEENLVNLTSFRFDMWNVTDYGVTTMVRSMGDQLLDLRICGDGITKHYLSDFTLGNITTSCPNLKHFAYEIKIYCSRYYSAPLDQVTGAGVTTLVEGCRRLEVLELKWVQKVTRADFEAILALIAASDGSDREFALRKINLAGYPFDIKENPFRIEVNALGRLQMAVAATRGL